MKHMLNTNYFFKNTVHTLMEKSYRKKPTMSARQSARYKMVDAHKLQSENEYLKTDHIHGLRLQQFLRRMFGNR